MRWLALVLILACIGVYYLPDFIGPTGRVAKVASGSLPRVASLKSEDSGRILSRTGSSPSDFPRSCVHLGWIESLVSARKLIKGLPLSGDAGFSIEEVDRELPPLHWVIVPPQPRDVALRQFQDIQRQGIDSYLVTEGENRNAISLGLFESRESAISVLEEKKRQNLNAVLANFPRNQISYALSFETESELVEELVQAGKADYGSNFDFVEIRPCEGVASPEKSP